MRDRSRYADVAELLAARGVRANPSSVYAWAREFATRYEDAARQSRTGVGRAWSVDETDGNAAGAWAHGYRAIDGQGQIVDMYARPAGGQGGGVLPPRDRGHRRGPDRGDDRRRGC